MAAMSEEKYEATFPQPQLDSDHTRQRFAGKVCIVTGAASGIGRSIAERFINDGANVHGFDINEERMESVGQALKSRGSPIEFHHVDVSDKAQCVAVVAKVAEKHGGHIHFLINCAAVFNMKALTAEKDDWDSSMSVNVQGPSNMVQACYPYMLKAGGKDCAVVNMASVSSSSPQKSRWTYNSTKAAIHMLTRCMALDLSPKQIRVNSVSPGWVWSPILVSWDGEDRKPYEDILGKYAMLNRLVEMAEVAAAVCFLCSKDAAFITGVDLPVDGGYSAMGPEGQGQETAPLYAEKVPEIS